MKRDLIKNIYKISNINNKNVENSKNSQNKKVDSCINTEISDINYVLPNSKEKESENDIPMKKVNDNDQ